MLRLPKLRKARWTSSEWGLFVAPLLLLAFLGVGTIAKGLWGSGGSTLQVLTTRAGSPAHTNSVESVAFSPVGKSIASGSLDHTIKFWNPHTGGLVRTLTVPGYAVADLAFSPDGDLLVTGQATAYRVAGTAKLWDVTTGRLLRNFKGHKSDVSAVAFSPDGKTLMTGGVDSTVRMWSVATGQLLRTLQGHSEADVRALTVSPDGRTILGGGGASQKAYMYGEVRLWDARSGQLLRTLTGHQGYVNGAVFSPDDQFIVTASDDWTVRLWQKSSGRLLQTVAIEDTLWSLAISPNGKYLAVGRGQGVLEVWKMSGGRLQRDETNYLDLNGTVQAVAFSPDGQRIVCGIAEGAVKMITLKDSM